MRLPEAPQPALTKVLALFRRHQSEPTSTAQAEVGTKPGGKGRPTPSRKEAEAAARARAKTPRTRKEMAAARSAESRKAREAMKGGDERYLPARDRGPMRRFIRDFVDVQFSMIELLIPIMVVSLVLSYSGRQYLIDVSEIVLLASMVFIVMNMVFLRLRLRRELTRRFPDESYKGTTYYAVMRAMQMKFMRLPKPQLKIGQPLPDTYR